MNSDEIAYCVHELSGCPGLDIDLDDCPADTTGFPEPEFNAAIRNAGVKFVSDFRSTSSATVSLCEKAVEGCNVVVETTVNHLKEFVLQRCQGKLPTDVLHEISEEFESCHRPLEFLSTDQKQRAYFQSMPTFVRPEKYLFGPGRFETVFGKDGRQQQKQVFDSWQYVPIEKSLKAFLAKPSVFKHFSPNFTPNTEFHL